MLSGVGSNGLEGEDADVLARLIGWSMAVVGAVCIVAGIAGCGERGAVDTGEDSDKPTIALIMKSLANEFFLTMENGAKAHQQEHAGEYELLANGIKDELDVDRQSKLVEQMIGRRVDAIVIAPADSKALIPVCKRAVDAGIVVVNIDNKFDDEVLQEMGVSMPFVGPDNRKGARMVGEYLAKKLQPGDAVAIIEGVPTAFNAQQRKAGFEDAMNAAGMKIVASQTADWDDNRANEVVSAILRAHPEIKGLLCANDMMALGAVSALQAAGKEGQVLVVGFDNLSAVQDLIREGRILATADQHADQLAVYGIEFALEMLKTMVAPADRETPVDLITAETLAESNS
jgi:ribose transport system substrate-binding protein